MTNQLLKAIEATLEAVEREMPENKVVLVYLTGSRLYGYAKEESDFDFKVYVQPTKRELLFSKKVSRQVAVNKAMVESVDVKSVLYLVEELKKPTLNSLHLLFEPKYFVGDGDYYLSPTGECLDHFSDVLSAMVEHSFKVNKKNLGLSLLSVVKDERKRMSRPSFSMMCYLLSKELYRTGELDAKDVTQTGQMVSFVSGFDKNFDSLQKLAFENWLTYRPQQDTVDYESLFLD